MCLCSFVDCDCNPYEGCEPRPPSAEQRCIYDGVFDDGGPYQIQCRQGNTCDRSTGLCVRTPQLGEPCRLGELNCGEGLLCASRSAVCVTPGARGADCEVDDACNEGLVCTLGTCMDPEPPGSSCDASTPCPPDTACNGGADPDPRRGECLEPQIEGGPCVWRPWLGEEDPGPSGCAIGFSCRPPDPPDPRAPGVDADHVDCRAAEEDPCFGLAGTCVADGSLEAGEPCATSNACASGRCSIAPPPWGLAEIDGYACTGDDCAQFAWPGFCVGEDESVEDRSCNLTDIPCARGLVCPPPAERDGCEPLGRSDDGDTCGDLWEGYIVLEELCVVGLECVEETLRCRRPGPANMGEACTVFADCGAGLGCSDEGRCVPYPTIGEACGPELPCTDAQCNRRDARCSAVTETRPATCEDDTDCPRGTFCWVEVTSECRPWGQLDGVCNQDGVVCDFGLVCRDSGIGVNRACLPPE